MELNMLRQDDGFRSLHSRSGTEKGSVQIAVENIPTNGELRLANTEIQWEPGFRAQFPWLGFGAMITMCICIVSTLAILATSDGASAEDWPAYEKWTVLKGVYRTKAQVEPHVLLAIVNTVCNVALAIAIGQGVAIAWWRKAMNSSTVADLHQSWGFASSLLELLTAGRKFNLIALAALTAKLALIDNVLLQKAAGVRPGFFAVNSTAPILAMVRELPANYTGIQSADKHTSGLTVAFSADARLVNSFETITPTSVYSFTRWANGTLFPGFDTLCNGFCFGDYVGFGFQWNCSDIVVSPNYTVTPELAFANAVSTVNSSITQLKTQNLDPEAYTEAYNAIMTTPLQQNPLLQVVPSFIAKGDTPYQTFQDSMSMMPQSWQNMTLDTASIGIHLRWSNITPNDGNQSIGTGMTSTRFCSLTPARVRYTVDITNIESKDDDLGTNTNTNGFQLGFRFQDEMNSTKPGVDAIIYPTQGSWTGTLEEDAYSPYTKEYDHNLANFADWLSLNYATYVSLEYMPANGLSSGNYIQNYKARDGVSSPFGQRFPEYDPSESCNITVSEPSSSLGTALDSLTFLSSMRAATNYNASSDEYGVVNNATIQNATNCNSFVPTVVYTTSWAWGISAMGTVFLCILLVLPSYWKFWELGRKVTLGPMEIANAFQAPVLAHPNVSNNGEVKQLVKVIGDREVKYGQVAGHSKLGVAAPTEVRSPNNSS